METRDAASAGRKEVVLKLDKVKIEKAVDIATTPSSKELKAVTSEIPTSAQKR